MYQDVCLISLNDISREGLAQIVRSDGFSIVGSYRDFTEIRPDVIPEMAIVLIDSPESGSSPRLIETIKEALPLAIVVILADQFDLKEMVDCFHAGAQGYIIKSMKAEPLLAALRLAAIGERVLPSDLVDVFDRGAEAFPAQAEAESASANANLSPREHDVICCLMAGYSNKMIARELSVCEATVKVHVKAILRKLKVNNRTQAAIWASSHGYSGSRLSI